MFQKEKPKQGPNETPKPVFSPSNPLPPPPAPQAPRTTAPLFNISPPQ